MKKLFCITVIVTSLFSVASAQTTYVLSPDTFDGKTILAGYYNQSSHQPHTFGFVVESVDDGKQFITEEQLVTDKTGYLFNTITLPSGNYRVYMFTASGDNTPDINIYDKLEFLVPNREFTPTAQN